MSDRSEKATAARVRAQIEKVRTAIAETKAEAAEVKRAPVPREELRAAAEARVAMSAARWRPATGSLARGQVGGSIALPDPLAGIMAEDALVGLVARLFGPQIVELLVAEEERALAGRPSGLPAAERPGKLEALAERLFALECDEERQIQEAEAAGIQIERRADADPAAVLGLPRRAA